MNQINAFKNHLSSEARESGMDNIPAGWCMTLKHSGVSVPLPLTD